MNLDITEEERDFLEKILTSFREEMIGALQSASYITNAPSLERDLVYIHKLIINLRKLDVNLIKKAIE